MNPPAPPPVRQTSALAIVSLVSGLLGYVLLPVIGSVVAIITGHLARREIRRDPGRYDGDGMAIAGLVLGYVAIGLGLLALVVLVAFFGGLLGLAALG